MFHIVVYGGRFLKALPGLLKEHIQRHCRCFGFSAVKRKEWTLTEFLRYVACDASEFVVVTS